MRLHAVLILPVLCASCSSNRLDPKVERDLIEAASMPSCARSATARTETDFDGSKGAVFAAYLKIGEGCKAEWRRRVQASQDFVCKGGVEFEQCSIGNASMQGQSGIMVMPRRDDMLVVIRYAPINRARQTL